MGSKFQCLFLFLERGRKGRECKFPKIAHQTFDPINSWPPVVVYLHHKLIVLVLVEIDPGSDFRQVWPQPLKNKTNKFKLSGPAFPLNLLLSALIRRLT